jgi:GT2 family glycosyltransferase
MVTLAILTPEDDRRVTADCAASLIAPETELRLAPWRGSFARTVNAALSGIRGGIVGAVNNDIVAPAQWHQLFQHFPEAGIVCPREADIPSFDPSAEIVRGAKGFFGGFWLMTATLFCLLGGLDERFEPYYCEDTDLIHRVEEAGYPIIQDHRVSVKHYQSLTIRRDPLRDKIMAKNVARFEEKWGFDPITYQH